METDVIGTDAIGTDTMETDVIGTDAMETDVIGTDVIGNIPHGNRHHRTDVIGTDAIGTDTMETDVIGTDAGKDMRKKSSIRCCGGRKEWQMKKALITGAAGFMGKALTEKLAGKGVQVCALVMPEKITAVPQKDLITAAACDLSSAGELEALLKDVQPDVLYHMAWHGNNTIDRNDTAIQMSNIPATMNVMKACAGSDVHVVIPGSTSEYAYCGGTVTGHREPAPGDFYAAVKSALQVMCRDFARRNGISLSWLLIGSVYGPGRTEQNLLTGAIRSMLKGERASFTALEQMWDYLYVDDLTEALYLAGVHGKADAVYPLGSGDARQLREYIEIVHQLIAPDLETGIGDLPYKNGKAPDNNVPDISAFIQDTGFSAKVKFEDGILETIRFFRECSRPE